MFLDVLVRRNSPLVTTAIDLHQRGKIPANSYVIDLDAVRLNAAVIAREAGRHGMQVLAMTKQVGRNPAFLRAVSEGGIDSFVAVDVAEARRISTAGYRVGHIGHLVQVPRREATTAMDIAPDFWTVFSHAKAEEAADAARVLDKEQKLIARIVGDHDVFYRGHDGGFSVDEVEKVAERLDKLDGANFAGITTFPALLFDHTAGKVQATPNMHTLEHAAQRLAKGGRTDIVVNAPGTTSTETLPILASRGATQVEPGHGLTGTTPLHAIRDLPELPAVLYVSEVSHIHGGHGYFFGGGLYIDPVFPAYQVTALTGSNPEAALKNRLCVELPSPEAIDYYGMLDLTAGEKVSAGDTVILGFRVQAFVTRAVVAPVSGIRSGKPVVEGLWRSDGSLLVNEQTRN